MSISFTVTTYAVFALLLLGFIGEAKHMAHDTAVMADSHEVRTALEVYNIEHGEYPATIDDLIPGYLSTPSNDDLNHLKYAQVAGGATYSLSIANQ